MFPLLTSLLTLAGAVPPPPSTVPAPLLPVVGQHVLLTEYASAFAGSRLERTLPYLTDAQGRGVPRFGWLNRPISVLRETDSAYVLSGGGAQGWLPKRNVQSKAVFPLSKIPDTNALAQEFSRKTVYINGQRGFPCEIVAGYKAMLTLQSAGVDSLWRIGGDGLNYGPTGGMTSPEPGRGSRVSSAGVLVMLRPESGLAVQSAAMELQLQDQSPELMKLAPQRCTSVPGIFGSADDLRRTLSTAPLPARPALPSNAEAAQRALIGWTRAQVLAQYGSPNEPGSLRDLSRLGRWTFGYAYGLVVIEFGPDGRVSKALITQSP